MAASGRGGRAGLPIVLVGAGLFGYDVLNHLAVVSGPRFNSVFIAALLASAAALVWAGFRRGVAVGMAVLAAAAGAGWWMASSGWALRLAPLLPQLAMCIGVAWLFGRTLLPGREPLITRVARTVHGELPPEIVRYTRNVTLAWAVFMAGMAITSVVLFALAPAAVWSVFANLLFLPLLGLMFLAEYTYRVLRYSWFPQVSIMHSVRAFRGVRATGAPEARR